MLHWQRSYISTMLLPAPVKRKRSKLYTIPEVASILGVSPRTISRLEADPLRVDADTLVSYLTLLGWRVGVFPRIKEL